MVDFKDFTRKMDRTLEVLQEDFGAVRAGRANASVLNRINVDYYGTPTPIQQIASVGSPDPRTLLITPWDANALKGIEKAIQESDLGINPQNDGKCIRLSFPQLTEERRKELVKQIQQVALDDHAYVYMVHTLVNDVTAADVENLAMQGQYDWLNYQMSYK